MANIFTQVLKWFGGLDMDSADTAIGFDARGQELPYANYRNARNIRTAINAANRGRALTNVLSNLQITTYILPYSGGVWPVGTNRCIGAHEDSNSASVIFFVWNSSGQNQILRYYRDLTDPNNPNGIIQQVMMYQGTGAGSGGPKQGFNWTRNTRITSINIIKGQLPENPSIPALPGTLMYFSDPTPHVIDIDRANICGKLKSWVFYPAVSGSSFAANSNFIFRVLDYNNNFVYTVNVPVATYNNPNLTAAQNNSAALASIATALNTQFPTLVNAVSTGVSLQVTETNPSLALRSFNYAYGGAGATPMLCYALNWYGANLTDRYFDRCQWQPMNVPRGTYLADPAYAPNNVQNNLFQFRLLNTYETASPSAPGIWSQIPINNLQCSGSSNILLNVIDVNFNTPSLLDNSSLVLFNQIWFIVRIQGNGTGTDQVVKQLYPSDFLDYVNGQWIAHYKFYNNIQSTPLDPAVAAQLFDDVPLTCPAELENANYMIEANIQQGQNPVINPGASYQIQIQPLAPQKMAKVTFIVRVFTPGLFEGEQGYLIPPANPTFYNFYPNLRKYPFFHLPNLASNLIGYRGGIFYNSTKGSAWFGGGSFGAPAFGQALGSFGVRTDMASGGIFDQSIVAWTVYAAGTQFFGQGQQIQVNDLPANDNGALDVSTNALQQAISLFYNSNNNFFNGNIYSTVTVMVPVGQEYIFRMPSHWCSAGDVLSKGFVYDLNGTQWQQTSTNVMGYVAADNQTWVNSKEIKLNVTGDTFAGTFVVADLAPPFDADTSGDGAGPGKSGTCWWQPINGYLMDSFNNGQVSQQPNDSDFQGIGIELAGVFADVVVSPNPIPGPVTPTSPNWNNGFTTDHNGYFFGICDSFYVRQNFEGLDVNVPLGQIQAYEVNNQQIQGTFTLWGGTLTNLFEKSLIQLNLQSKTPQAWVADGIVFCILPTNTVNARTLTSTYLDGNIQDEAGNNVEGVSIVAQSGHTTQSDVNGNYELIIWGDMVTPNLATFSSTGALVEGTTRIGVAVYSAPSICQVNYPNGQELAFNIAPPNNGFGVTPLYNNSNPYQMALFVLQEILYATSKVLKRGGTYIAGIHSQDYPGRQSTDSELFKIYVPYDTEDLSRYPYVVQSNGQPYPAGSFIMGQPIILWNFNNAMKPTVGAASYDITLTPDLFYGNYLQWVVNSVQYVSQTANLVAGTPPVDTSYANGNAVAVLLDITTNANIYNAANPGANIGYSYTPGDRVRFILDQNQNLLQSPATGIYDFPITGVYSPVSPATGAPYQLVVAIPNLPFEIYAGFTIEVYTPAPQNTTETQLLYEMGMHYFCTLPGSPNNTFGTTSGQFTGGDTYWRGRLITVADPVTAFTGTYTALVEAQDASDFFPSIASDAGRPSQIDPEDVSLNRPTAMVVSGQYLPGSATNGLSTFNDNNPVEAEIDRRYGSIQRLFYENNVLQVVCSNKNITAPIYRNVLNSEGENYSSIVSISGQFFNPQNFRIEAKNLGVDFPQACCTNSGIIFGFTNYRANMWRWFGNEAVTSDKNMITFFKQLQLDGITDCVMAYHKFYEEVIATYWRQYSVNAVPTISDAGNFFSFSMPVPASPVAPIYGNLGQPPAVNSQITFTIVISGITYTFSGIVSSVVIEGANYFIVAQTEPAFLTIANTVQNLLAGSIQNAEFTFSLPETILWCEGTDMMKQKGEGQEWRGFLDDTPEYWCPIGADMVSFINGQLYLTTGQGVTPNTQRNTFYGVQYPSIITPVFNGVAAQHNMLNKVWNALSLWGTQGLQVGGGNPGSNNWFSNPANGSGIGVSNTYGQQSRLNAVNWLYDENHWSIDFLRDLNDISIPPNPLNPANPLGNRVNSGMVLRSEALTVELINNYPGEIVLYSVKGNYTLSAGPLR